MKKTLYIQSVMPLLSAALIFFSEDTTQAASQISIAGDSIVSSAPSNSAAEKHGWGEKIGGCFKSGAAKTSNFAKGGRSTKSFYKEGIWKDLLRSDPKWILLQFGHNDQSHATQNDDVGTSPSEYGKYLQRYIDESKKNGANLIMVTPPPRKHFSGSDPAIDLKPYAETMKKVAAANSVPVVDLWTLWYNRMKQAGNSGISQYYIKTDDTHFNMKGATELAAIICSEAKAKSPGFAKIAK